MLKHWRHCSLAITSILLLSGCKLDGVPYLSGPDYAISGAEDIPPLNKYLDTLMDNRLADKQPAAEGEDKARQDIYRREMIVGDLLKGLEAKGYYDGSVVFKPGKNVDDGTYAITPGEQYHVTKITIAPSEQMSYIGALKIKQGDLLDAQAVVDSEQALLRALAQDHCYFTLNVTHTATINKKQKTGAVVFHLDVGRDAKFGPENFVGQSTINDSYLRKLLPWKEGDCFRRDKIESLRASLLESGLFSKAEAILPDQPDENGAVPVTINLTERAQRTVKIGASYYTDEGAGITLGWEHRNLFGGAEKLNIDVGFSQLKQSLDIDLVKPYFLRKDQSLSLTNSYRHQDTDAYKETAIDLGGNLSRKFNRYLSGTTGAKFTLSRIDDKSMIRNGTESYALFSLPQTIGYDNRDSKLDPHKGWVVNGSVAPFFDALGNSNPFFKSQLTASTYLRLAKKGDVVLALRGNIGSITGTTTADVPATERFYAGGGGSVRGYGYQKIGPSKDGQATGGRSIAESSVELRFKMTETLGAVTFLDAGSVSDNAVPDFDNLSAGAGVGLRYYTAMGPLRFDVGVPLNKSNKDDKNFQVYISIGQAF